MSRGATIDMTSLGFAYAGASDWALSGLNMSIGLGEEVLVSGSNAAGKTTLLNLIAGVIPEVISGHVAGELSVASNASSPPSISMIRQDSGVYLFNTVEEEVSFVLRNRGVRRAGLAPLVGDALEKLGIEGLRQRQMHTLSGGERQKVALAAALAAEPDVLLLDEPFEQLDPASALESLALAEALTEQGVTLVVAARDHERLDRATGRLYLDRGRSVRSAPATPKLAPRSRNAAGDPLLEMRGISFRYNGGPGIADVDLEVREGECVALVGPNGAGKTTLMKHANGMIRPHAGEVRVRDRDIAARPVWDTAHDVAFLFQNPDDQIFSRRVIDEVAWPLRNWGAAQDEATARAEAALDELGIAHLAAENPHELTASQRQLVGFASLLVSRPALLVLDEPTKSLDHLGIERVAGCVGRMLESGSGALLVTHDFQFAAAMADRVIVLAEGRVTAEGPTQEVLSNTGVLREARLLV